MAMLFVSLIVVCVFDYARQKIPNPLILLILLAGAGRGFYQEGLWGAGIYVLKSVIVLFLLYPLFRIGGLGAGDVKLLGICSGYFLTDQILFFLFFSMLISAAVSIVKLLKERDAWDRVQYFVEYCKAVAQSGKWRLYLPEKGAKKLSGVCMSGPILCSVLLGLGGVY